MLEKLAKLRDKFGALKLLGLDPQAAQIRIQPSGDQETRIPVQNAVGKAAADHEIEGTAPTRRPKIQLRRKQQRGHGYASHGNELTLKRRVFACFEHFGTELLIVDEVQHLNYRNGLKNDVTDTLKGMLDAGLVPMAFLGTEDAEQMFRRNLQLNGRLLAPCDIRPLDPKREDDRRNFAQFVARLENVIVDEGILRERSDLAGARALAPLFEVSAGVVGRVSRLFQVGLEFALRRGAHRLEPCDLADAVDQWAIEQNFISYNPVRGLIDA